MTYKTLILSLLLTLLSISIAVESLDWDATVIFLPATIAIISLAAWTGTASEELAVIGLTLGGLLNSVSSDGRSDWLEGVLLLATYLVVSVAFFYHPV